MGGADRRGRRDDPSGVLRKMSKKVNLNSIPAAVMIQRAAKASRTMTVPERLQLMLKAGLLTQEQAEKAAKLRDWRKARVAAPTEGAKP